MIQPRDVIRFTTRRYHDGKLTTTEGLVLSVHKYDSGGLQLSYQYASNPRGIAWSCYIAPDLVDSIEVIDHRPDASITPLSLIPG